ncbi:PD40 domain-containing protein [Adhaeribacter sp. BT258]|uniref:PD40 domain-containing protein n=1 Tax=Adhaeribacter terrigena TaxID=2793070 RepID=A0ABS1C5T2_9BACT|nr:carboxypeptidase regulatory-like domain-containing protein [Adhaeribacter terrigena]MBK0404730.1 PD40 domain-containing protein [Adhaeribacter terrigena]
MYKNFVSLRLLLLAALPLFWYSCKEDTVEPHVSGTITGVVVEAETNAVLENVSITSNPASSAIATDNTGRFQINEVTVGNYSVTAKKVGYRTTSVNILVARDKISDIRIILEKSDGTNKAPNKPMLALPGNQSEKQPVSVRLVWSGSDPDEEDSLTYTVELFESGMAAKRLIAQNSKDTSAVADGLKYNTVYYWQVTAQDPFSLETKSDIWSFRTLDMPNFKYLFVKEMSGSREVFTADSISQVRLTNTAYQENQPLLSPLRDKIAFTTNEYGQWHIFTMNRDGSNKRRVTVSFPVTGYHNDGLGYAWSPDGSQLIYAHYDKIYKINRNGTGNQLLATAPANRHFRQLDWTDQGNKIIAQTMGTEIFDSELYLMNDNGTGMTQFLGNMPGRIESPSFSINGQNVLFTRDVEGFNAANGRQLNSHIFLMRLNKSDTIDLSLQKPAGFNDTNPRFSPNGAQVIFEQASNAVGSPREIWIMDLDGNNRRKLFNEGEMPDWK